MKESMKLALEAAYLAGWNASGEGYNAEYPFGDHARNPEEDAAWIKDRDNVLREALVEQPAPVQQCMEHGECFGGKCIYTSPPAQRTWVGLVDNKGDLDFGNNHVTPEFAKGALWAEAKLKEKNT